MKPNESVSDELSSASDYLSLYELIKETKLIIAEAHCQLILLNDKLNIIEQELEDELGEPLMSRQASRRLAKRSQVNHLQSRDL